MRSPAGILATRIRSAEKAVEGFLARRLSWPLVVASATAAVFALRCAVALQFPSAGGDYGHYLIAANWYAGRDNTGEGPFDPPLVPLLVLALQPMFGVIGTLQILGPLAGAALVPGAAYFVSRFVPRWAALAGAVTFSLWQTFTEFITYGGVTNLFGIALSLVFFRLFYEALANPAPGLRPRREDLVAAAVLFAVVSTHHLTAFVTGSTILGWVAVSLLLSGPRRRDVAFTSLRIIGLATVASLAYLPYLVAIVSTDVAGGLGAPVSPRTAAESALMVWRQTLGLWAAFIVLGVLAVARLTLHDPLTPVVTAIAATPLLLLLTILLSHPVRTFYFEHFAVVLLPLLWLAPAKSMHLGRKIPERARIASRSAVTVLLVLALVVLPLATPPIQQEGSRHYHQFLSGGTLEAFDWLAANTERSAVVAVDAPLSPQYNERWMGMVTGWWFEGYANRRAVFEANPYLLSFRSKWEDAKDANRLFSGETFIEDGVMRIAEGFPAQESASPMFMTGYLGDYHELIGLRSPRLVDLANDSRVALAGLPSSGAVPGVTGNVGRIETTFSSPEAAGWRRIVFDGNNETVDVKVALALPPSSPFDAFELIVAVPSWTYFETRELEQGVLRVGVPDTFGYDLEDAEIQLGGEGVFGPSLTRLGTEGVFDVYSVVWALTDRSFQVDVLFRLVEGPTTGPGKHPLRLRTASEILESQSISHLLVSTQSVANVGRFDADPSRFERAYSNADFVVYRVL